MFNHDVDLLLQKNLFYLFPMLMFLLEMKEHEQKQEQ